MMVFTDRERRRVAERLRGAAEGDVTVTRAVMGDLGEFSGEDVALRLADMVEPDEPPCNLQTLYEAVFRRPTRRWECIDDAEVEELLDALLRLCNSPARELLARREPADGLSRGDSGDVTTMSAYDLLAKEDRDALRWVREHGGIGQVRLHHALGDGLSDLVDRVAARLGVTVEGLDAQDAEPVLMGAIDRRVMPEGVEWPRFEDDEPVMFGDEFVGCEGAVVRADIVMFGEHSYRLQGYEGTGHGRAYDYGDRVERPDTWELLEGDVARMASAWRSERDLFDAQRAAACQVGEETMGRALDSIARRARALAGRDA